MGFSEIEALTFGHENVTDSLVEVNLTPAEASALRSNATVSMFVRTRKSHGLLFYLGNGDSLDGAGDDDTFLAAEWESGVLRVSVKINGTPESLVDKVGRRLDDGNYHFLRVSLVNRTLSADVNGSTLFSMEVEASKDRRLDASRLYLGGLPPPRFGVERDAFHSSSSALVSLSSLPPPPPLAPSGTIVAAVPRVTGVPFFKGIMQDVRVSCCGFLRRRLGDGILNCNP